MNRLLIVEDEPDMVTGLKDNFELEGFEVRSASDGVAGLEMARRGNPHVVILDVMLPRMSGLEVCKALRREGCTVPILMLTARGQELDKVVGLEVGADDYVTKPFSVRELIARVHALLRRAQAGAPASRLESYSFGDVRLDFKAYRATRGDQRLDLSPRELDLLRYLIERKGETVSRERLLSEVWGYGGQVNSRTVDAHITKVRAKIGDNKAQPRLIVTVHGVGYRFVEPPASGGDPPQS
jgi:two-component system alkaline phosphatase synthesis response regulator PhoP